MQHFLFFPGFLFPAWPCESSDTFRLLEKLDCSFLFVHYSYFMFMQYLHFICAVFLYYLWIISLTWFLSSDHRRPCQHSLWSLQRFLRKAPATNCQLNNWEKYKTWNKCFKTGKMKKKISHSTQQLCHLRCPAEPACFQPDLPCSQPEIYL